MHRIFSTDVIILSKRNLSNLDIEFLCYSKDYGVASFWQKVHSSKKFRAMDFFCYSKIKFFIYNSFDENIYKIVDFDILDYNYNIRLDFQKLEIVSFFSKILSKNIFKDCKEIFYLLKEFLYTINYKELSFWDLEILKFLFFMKILQLDGYGFQIKECLFCRSFLPENVKTLYFSVDFGGIICNKCIQNLNFYEKRNLVLINLKILKLLKICYAKDVRDFFVLNDQIFFKKSDLLGFDLFFEKVSRYYI